MVSDSSIFYFYFYFYFGVLILILLEDGFWLCDATYNANFSIKS